VEQVVQSGRIARIDELPASECGGEDEDFGVIPGLRFAVPLGLGIWALVIWGVVHFLA
jgi:hypothetical protein